MNKIKNAIKTLKNKIVVSSNEIKTITDSPDKKIKVDATCAIVSRKPQNKVNDFKTAVIRFYDSNNPHKTGKFPSIEYEFTNIEKIRLKGLNISYYLEGNDLIINDLEELFLIHEDTLLIIKGYQFEVERRK